MLCSSEDNDSSGRSGETSKNTKPVVVADRQDVVRHLLLDGFNRVDAAQGGVYEVLTDDGIDAVVQGGGEKQPLRMLRRAVEKPFHAGEETHVSHVICLVENGDFAGVESDVTGLHVIKEAAGTGNNDVNTHTKRLDLRHWADPTKHGGDLETECVAERSHHRFDLDGQLSGGYEDHGARTAGTTLVTAVCETGKYREGERKSFARSRAAPAEYIAAGDAVHHRGSLDREGPLDSLTGELPNQGLRHTEFGE